MSSPKNNNDQKNLSMLTAVLHALIPFKIVRTQAKKINFEPRKIDFYPRQSGQTVIPDVYLPKMMYDLKRLDALGEIDERYLDRAKESLKEVKDLTEYQDQKAARLLTIVAFLTAAAGALFAKMLDAYPIHQVFLESTGKGAFLAVAYGLFGLFLILVACGALVIFHATQSRFVWPKEKSDEAKYQKANSFLFYQSIFRTDPVGWSSSFVDHTSAKDSPDRLTPIYYKNYISEAYLIAAKLGDKLRYLQPGQQLLQYAIRILLIWLLLLFAVALWIQKPTGTQMQSPLIAPICYPCQAPLSGAAVSPPAAASSDAAPTVPASAPQHIPASAVEAVGASAASDKVRLVKHSGTGHGHDQTSRTVRRGQHAMGHGLGLCNGAANPTRRTRDAP